MNLSRDLEVAVVDLMRNKFRLRLKYAKKKADMGHGILLDHATGVVVAETAVIGNNVPILHNVTLGGTGKVCGDRHPNIGDGVLIWAGTCILGNLKIGDWAKIGAGSVVLKDVTQDYGSWEPCQIDWREGKSC